jgi:hypothetical protein
LKKRIDVVGGTSEFHYVQEDFIWQIIQRHLLKPGQKHGLVSKVEGSKYARP